MSERLATARCGVPTAYAGEKALHSRYDPRVEAEKYVETLSLRDNIRFFILIEPALGYVIPVLRRKFPGAAIVVLHVSDFFAGQSAGEDGLSVWTPGMGLGVQEFLEKEIPDVPAAAVRIVEWRPALAAYGRIYLEVLSETAEFIKRIDANTRTTRGFGRRWIKNFFRNLGIIKKTLRYTSAIAPVVITGAGPGLEEVLPLICKEKKEKNLFVLAAASSVKALLAGDVVPDLVISTDGGNWALLHLREALRKAEGENPMALAAGLTAALPSQCSLLPVLPISEGSLWQRIVLDALGFPHLSLPQRGTVTAAALDLALSLTKGPVFLAGMDLSGRDIRTHVRPYGFDRLREEGVSRLDPSYSRAFVRARSLNAAGTYRIYAAWFKGQLASYPGRLYSLGANNPVFASLPGGDGISGTGSGEGPAAARGEGDALSPVITAPAGDSSLPRLAVRILEAALENPACARPLCGELSPLLWSGESRLGPEDVRAEIRLLSGPYIRENSHG
jgi:hypothetical protein